MSKFQKPTLYNSRGLQNGWINLVYGTHDQICGCNDPIAHLNDLINKQKCHRSDEPGTTVATTGTTDIQDAGYDEGDLEKLFENDTQDKEG